MSEPSASLDRPPLGRLARLAIEVGAGGPVVFTVLLWLQEQIPAVLMWKAGLAFLVVIKVAYGVVLMSALGATPALGVLLYQARRCGSKRPAIGRGLLLCASLLLGLAMAEAGAAVWQLQLHQGLSWPVRGEGRGEGTQGRSLLADTRRKIELPKEFPGAQGDDGVNLVVIGESSAAGVPYESWLSVGHIIAWQLGEAIPSRRFRLRVLAGSGETLERQHRLLGALDCRPDVLIIYCGHNEFSSRVPWSRSVDHYSDERIPSFWKRFVARVEKTSPLCNLITEQAEQCRIAIPPSRDVRRPPIDVPAYTAGEFAELLADFGRRLELIVAYAEQVGALPILIVPAANDSGFEPNRSFLPGWTSHADREAFARNFRDALVMEATNPAGSIERYRSLLARQPGFALTHYRMARLLESAGAWDEAYQHDVAARDLDGLPMRCLTRFQDAYRAVAARHDCILIDSQAYFHAIARHGLLDDGLFQDGMHPALRGLIALAQAVLQRLAARRSFGWPASLPAPILDPAQCAKRFGVGPEQWKRVCLWGIMFYDLTAPMHYDPSARRAKQKRFGDAYNLISAGQAPESVGLPNLGIPTAVPVVLDAVFDPLARLDRDHTARPVSDAGSHP